MGVAFALFLLPIILIVYVFMISLKWIMLAIIIMTVFCMIIEIITYRICKKKNYFDKIFLENIRNTKYGQYKKLVLVIVKNGLKISIAFSIIVVIFCSLVIYFNPFSLEGKQNNEVALYEKNINFFI